jgi:prepilin-type N-terminal cleavage/methylation domain-containing protein
MTRRKAFTFLELLLALTVFSVGILSVLKIFPLSKRYLNQSAMTTQASSLAQEQVEIIRSLPYSSVTAGLEARHTLATTGAFSQFERQTTVQLIDSNYQPTNTDVGLKKITVDVFWLENLTVSRQLTIHTFVYNK